MKKLIAIVLTLTAILSTFAVTASAADNPLTVTVDGTAVAFPDQQPVIKNSRTLVPVRFIAEALGYEVEWDEKVNAAVIDHGRIVMYIGTNHAIIDGKHKTLDVKSELIGDRTMVPLRVIAETLDCTVDWLNEIRTVQINRKNEDGTEKSVWDRLMMSGMFTKSDDQDSGYYGCAVLGNSFDTSKIPDWYVKQNRNKLQYNADSYECEIRVEEFDAKTLTEIKNVLMIVYPNGY
ncbi:MAG: copper amine oxidase N-terminal domain-containing protein, partial [Clostridia bacterium]|nr:copper amine oxidase N-terminal domain-containing protein [Clostridia bacterium]